MEAPRVSLPQVGIKAYPRSARRSRGTTPVEKCKFVPLCSRKNEECLSRKEQVYLVPYNDKLCCPELSPWLQHQVLKKLRKERKEQEMPDFNKENHYTWLLRRRDRTKPLTVTFRYHQQTESYIEEYRTFKSPGEHRVHNTTLPFLPNQYPNIKSYTANISKILHLEEVAGPYTSKHAYVDPDRLQPTSSMPKLTSTEEVWNKNKEKWSVLKDKYSQKQFAHINNAKGPTPPRVPIKIPKCETRATRPTKSIFPVILSKFRSSAMSNYC